MEITLEQVERLREKADVSYVQAKQALEYSQGNLLDALIYLEEQGVIPRPQQTYYSTQSTAVPVTTKALVRQTVPQEQKKTERGNPVGRVLRALRRGLLENELEVWRRQQPVTALPMLILIILLVFAFWATVPILLFGLFLGFRYRFSGPDLEDENLNSMMEKMASTADDVGRRVMDELHAQHEKRSKDREEP